MTSTVIIIGGSGALGKSFISHFNSLDFVRTDSVMRFIDLLGYS